MQKLVSDNADLRKHINRLAETAEEASNIEAKLTHTLASKEAHIHKMVKEVEDLNTRKQQEVDELNRRNGKGYLHSYIINTICLMLYCIPYITYVPFSLYPFTVYE